MQESAGRDKNKYRYTVRLISVPEDGAHECKGRIVAALQSTYNPGRKKWYLTALVERPIEGPEGP